MQLRKWLLLMMVAVVVIGFSHTGTASASAPYRSYGYFKEQTFPVQSLYVPERVIGDQFYAVQNGSQESLPGLNGPTDLFIDNEDHIYVSDTNNNRVVKMNDRGQLLLELGTGADERSKLKAPEGIYVSSNGNIYVADTGNNRIAVFNRDGMWIDEILKPGSMMLQEVTFMPSRVSVDLRGFLYIAAKGVNEGLIVISPDKEFAGFFGSNKVELSALDRIKNLFYTEEQKRTAIGGAASVSDLFIDSEGFVYTTTIGARSEQIKKYNVGGENMFSGENMRLARNSALAGTYTGITVDRNGNIFALDAGAGQVFQFDPNGEPVFSFGDKLVDNKLRMGLFGDPVSIKVNSRGYLYVTDKMFNAVQVFRPTEFMTKVNQAEELFNSGNYEEAMRKSQDVLKSNVFYYKAHFIIGKALYMDTKWAESMERFELVFDTAGYSDAFWELRIHWVRNHFYLVISILLAAAAVYYVGNKVIRRRRGHHA